MSVAHPRNEGRVTELVGSQWDHRLRPGERGWNVFWLQRGDTSGGKTGNISHSAFAPALNFSHSSHRIAFFPLATKQTDSLFIFITWPIYKTASWWVAAPETRSKSLIQLQIADWKAVTSASASHGSTPPSSLGDDTLFLLLLLLIHTFVTWPAYSASRQLPCPETSSSWAQITKHVHYGSKCWGHRLISAFISLWNNHRECSAIIMSAQKSAKMLFTSNGTF